MGERGRHIQGEMRYPVGPVGRNVDAMYNG